MKRVKQRKAGGPETLDHNITIVIAKYIISQSE